MSTLVIFKRCLWHLWGVVVIPPRTNRSHLSHHMGRWPRTLSRSQGVSQSTSRSKAYADMSNDVFQQERHKDIFSGSQHQPYINLQPKVLRHLSSSLVETPDPQIPLRCLCSILTPLSSPGPFPPVPHTPNPTPTTDCTATFEWLGRLFRRRKPCRVRLLSHRQLMGFSPSGPMFMIYDKQCLISETYNPCQPQRRPIQPHQLHGNQYPRFNTLNRFPIYYHSKS